MKTTEEVTPKYVRNKMFELGVKIKNMQEDTGINKTNISAWINEIRPMSKPVKAMFYLYLQYKENQLK